MCGPISGNTVPIPRNPRNVAPISAQKRPPKERTEDPIAYSIVACIARMPRWALPEKRVDKKLT
jgi:hypothetical protein